MIYSQNKKLAGSPAERRWETTGVVGPKQDTGWRYGGKTWDALKQPIAVQLCQTCLRPANGERGGGTGLHGSVESVHPRL